MLRLRRGSGVGGGRNACLVLRMWKRRLGL
jgi:hypothetical protein